MKVAAVQMRIQDKDMPANLATITRHIKESTADIVCFPETSLTGVLKPGHHDIADALQRLEKTCLGQKRWAIFGGYASRGGGVRNEVYVLNDRGGLEKTYVKAHLWNEEDVLAGIEANNELIQTPWGKIAVINCWDIAFPEYTRRLARQGADVVFCPAYWFPQEGADPDLTRNYNNLVEARAFENQVFFVLADSANEETAGASRIVSPVQTLARAREEERVEAELDLTSLVGLRTKYNCGPQSRV